MTNQMVPSREQILSSLSQLRGKKVLVIGDVGIDEYVTGQVRRISPEAPVPVLDVDNEEERLGLSANVAQNVTGLGGEPILVSVIGNDLGGEKLCGLLRQSSISTDFLVKDTSRATTRKQRVMTGPHHIVRVDYEDKRFISKEIENSLVKQIENAISKVDVVILEDYGKGVMTESLLKAVMAIGKNGGKRVLLDPHRTTPVGYYAGVDILKPNYDEALALTGLNFDELRETPDKMEKIGKTLKKLTGARDIVVTQGKEGMSIFSDDKIAQVPTYARKVFDVTGAGDTVIAALAMGFAAGLPIAHSCSLANYAAGVVVGKIGCVPCTLPELEAYIRSHT
ncbi:MAG: D-glycero-beta-D-manno-heptose-7-phosphate kinase [Pseudobdellovibrionaceae bacterium]